MTVTPTKRTRTEKLADKIDLKLYPLIAEAERIGCTTAAGHLRAARVEIRWKMHPEDRDATSAG
jgi:hypothetical protein